MPSRFRIRDSGFQRLGRYKRTLLALPAYILQDRPRPRPPAARVKYDGYRLILAREDKRARLFTRKGIDWTSRFP
jgi:ATP-dependent DNA ligase